MFKTFRDNSLASHSRIIFFVLLLFSIALNSQNETFIKDGESTIKVSTYGQGEPLLIINGGPGMNSEGFKFLAKELGKSNLAILYDQRGTGNSKMPEINNKTITLDLMVEDIETIRKYFGFENWTVFGHSFGGMLGSYYTSKFPNKVKGLVLSSSGGISLKLFKNLNLQSRLTQIQRDSLRYWNREIASGDTSYHARLQRGKYLAPAYIYTNTHRATIAKRLTQGNSTINQLVWQNMRQINFDCSSALKKVDLPVLIIHGKQDVVDLSVPKLAHTVFKNSTLVILDKCVHYGWLDQPEAYFTTIDDFFTTNNL